MSFRIGTGTFLPFILNTAYFYTLFDYYMKRLILFSLTILLFSTFATAMPGTDTQETITNRLKAIYAHVSKAYDISLNEYVDLDKLYCSRDWQETYAAVEELDNQKETAEEMFFVEDMHWTNGLEVPLSVDNFEITMKNDGTALVLFNLCDTYDNSMRQCVSMVFEDDEWKIDSWISPWGDWNMLEDMKNYIINKGQLTRDN